MLTPPESASPESLSPESPPPKFISPSSKLILPESFLSEYTSSEPLSPEPSLLEFISPESPSSKSPSPKPQSALFFDRGLKVQVWLDASFDNGGYNNGRGRGSPIFCDSLLDIDTPQDWWQMLRNLQQIIDLQFVPILEASPEIVDVFVVWDGDVPPECDGWSKWLKCKRWNDIGVKTMKLYKSKKGPRIFSSRISVTSYSVFLFTSHKPLLEPSIETQRFYSGIGHLSRVHNKMSDRPSSSAQLLITPVLQIRAMNISDGSLPFLCNTPLGIISPPDFSTISHKLIQTINVKSSSEKFSCIERDISIFVHWAGETPDKYAYQTASRCWNNILLDLMLLSEKKPSVDSPDELKDLWVFLAKRKYRDEIFCVFEASPIPRPDRTSELRKAIKGDLIHSDE
ncbi:hypothetical protein BHYA_0331g00100 [Botrytis hyacinthi]|uniref:Uncharacterized protein n=1 Tax=Botrytis hyacinthi TaxID=278943 RepID=A0A4Z1GA66_9HELO|nr:hypothetical protein BHYA_0331g00100 [Botrytis hyacinthi]